MSRMENNGNTSPYCAEVRGYATDLLGYLRQPGGTMPSSFTYGLFELWAKADEENKELIKQGWRFAALVLRAHETGGAAALRGIAGLRA